MQSLDPNVKIAFFPPIKTCLVECMKWGVIKAFKCHYICRQSGAETHCNSGWWPRHWSARVLAQIEHCRCNNPSIICMECSNSVNNKCRLGKSQVQEITNLARIVPGEGCADMQEYIHKWTITRFWLKKLQKKCWRSSVPR